MKRAISFLCFVISFGEMAVGQDAQQTTQITAGESPADDIWDNWTFFSPHKLDSKTREQWRFANSSTFSFNWITGSSSSLSLSGNTLTTVGKRHWIFTNELGTSYMKSGDPSQVVSKSFYGSQNVEWHFHERIFLFGEGGLEKNIPQSLDLAYYLGNGLGAYIFQTPQLSLKWQESYRFLQEDLVAPLSDISDHLLVSGLNFNWLFQDKLTFSFIFKNLLNLENAYDFRISTTPSLRINLISHLDASLSYELDYDNRPQAGTKSVETQTLVSLGFNWQ